MKALETLINIEEGLIPLRGLLTKTPEPIATLLLAHGAGAGMEHPFMEMIAERLAYHAISVLRWNFPYMEAGSKRPDSPKKAISAWKTVGQWASANLDDQPLFVGGKSFGGRMASLALAEGQLPDRILGAIYLGFPLHAAGKPATDRANHLSKIQLPSLFLSGTRDALADLSLLQPIIDALPKAMIQKLAGADHSFKVLKRSGIPQDEVYQQLADSISLWVRKQL